MLHRITTLTAAAFAVLAIAAVPLASAGEDDTVPVTPPVTTTPAPPPAPVPAPTVEIPQSVQNELDRLANEVRDLKREASNEAGSSGGGGGGGGNSGASNSNSSAAPSYTPVAAQSFTVPQGGVQAGAGGTAQDGSVDLLPAGIAGLGLVLAASGFALRRRFMTE